MASEEEEEDLEVTSSVLHWSYRNLKRFPRRLLERPHRVRDIYLKENRISRVPEEIGRLERLESLHLSGNDLARVPAEIGLLRRLRHLDLSGNLLTALPEQLGELSALRALVLDDNRLTALPLRLADLRELRYMSAYDNRLRWLAQRPVHNLRQCELRVWRNPTLRSLPYHLWFHAFREQRVPCFTIGYGCLSVSGIGGGGAGGGGGDKNRNGCILKIHSESAEWKMEISPGELVGYGSALSPHELAATPPPLAELCLRLVYRLLAERAASNRRAWSDDTYCREQHTSQTHEECYPVDENNNTSIALNPSGAVTGGRARTSVHCACSNAYQLVERHLPRLPLTIQRQLQVGPVSRCENTACKSPVFDHPYLHFYTGSLDLLESSQQVLLSAVFCCRRCADAAPPGALPPLLWHYMPPCPVAAAVAQKPSQPTRRDAFSRDDVTQ